MRSSRERGNKNAETWAPRMEGRGVAAIRFRPPMAKVETKSVTAFVRKRRMAVKAGVAAQVAAHGMPTWADVEAKAITKKAPLRSASHQLADAKLQKRASDANAQAVSLGGAFVDGEVTPALAQAAVTVMQKWRKLDHKHDLAQGRARQKNKTKNSADVCATAGYAHALGRMVK